MKTGNVLWKLNAGWKWPEKQFKKCLRYICHDFEPSTKIRLLRCYIYPILLYETETRTLTEILSKKIGTPEMWLYRLILKISYTYRASNVRILQRMRKEKELMMTIN